MGLETFRNPNNYPKFNTEGFSIERSITHSSRLELGLLSNNYRKIEEAINRINDDMDYLLGTLLNGDKEEQSNILKLIQQLHEVQFHEPTLSEYCSKYTNLVNIIIMFNIAQRTIEFKASPFYSQGVLRNFIYKD